MGWRHDWLELAARHGLRDARGEWALVRAAPGESARVSGMAGVLFNHWGGVMSRFSREHPFAAAHARLCAAVSRYRLAEENCPHWDYESDGEAGFACCHELADAITERRRARAALAKVQS